jgi:hypothetical protein
VYSVVERLDRISVAGGDEELRLRVIETEREFATEMGEKRQAMLFVQEYRNLRVAFALELVALCAELFSYFVVAVKLAVYNGMYISFWVVKGLLGIGIEIDDS